MLIQSIETLTWSFKDTTTAVRRQVLYEELNSCRLSGTVSSVDIYVGNADANKQL